MTQRVLFIHQNFPGQFKHLAPALAGLGHEVTALSMKPQPAGAGPQTHQGVRQLSYSAARGSTAGVHPWLADFETKTIRAEACLRACLALAGQGYTPDAVVAHPGWGEPLFVKDVWPQTRLGLYAEFYYQTEGADTGFDPEFPVREPVVEASRLRLKNLNSDLQFARADAAVSPTRWQASTFAPEVQAKTTVVHDGIDTDVLTPRPDATLRLQHAGGQLQLSRSDEVITFVNRNLEPYRGYHVFMRALPALLRARPKARVLLVGGDGVSYGAKPDPKKHGAVSWKEVFINEVRPQISEADWARVHFVGNLPYPAFVSLLQISTVHLYWTYPFVLSWSLLEAMSLGCAVVASRTAPVLEAVKDGKSGCLVDFFDTAGLVNTVCRLLETPEERARLGHNARQHAQSQYDLKRVCLPKQLAWVDALLAAQPAATGGR